MSLTQKKIAEMSPEECVTIREMLDRVGDRWSIYVIAQLRYGPLRFNALKRSIEGISQRMLTLTVRSLERDGLVARTVYPTNPPQVEYALTDLGRTLLQPISALITWAESHQEQVQKARNCFDSVDQNTPISTQTRKS